MDKETSSRVSSIAGNIMRSSDRDLEMMIENDRGGVIRDLKMLAGSALSQDETPGQASGIHPAPAEFTEAQIALDPLLHFFHYAHLPERLQDTSKFFFLLAHYVVNTLPRNAERTVALRKLLEAKDAAVRANLPAPGFSEKQRVASEPELGEPVETGGHDEDRDGPIPFGG